MAAPPNISERRLKRGKVNHCSDITNRQRRADMLKNSLVVVLVSVLTLIFACTAFAGKDEFKGGWENVDCNTNGITMLSISDAQPNDELKIQAFGKCVPHDCDWGTVALTLYGTNTTDNDYKYASAVFKQHSITCIVILHMEENGQLSVDSFTTFKDTRENYHMHYHFRKTGKQCVDLIVEKIDQPRWDNESHTSKITVTITNMGNAKSGKSYARITDPSTPQPTGAPFNDVQEVPELNPGQSFTVTFTLPYWVFNPDASLTVEADYKKMVDECNESNNIMEFNQLG